jgi:hypothetical protein
VRYYFYDDSAFVHVKDPSESSHALWTVTLLSNGKYAIKGDKNEYLFVCYKCIRPSRWDEYAFVEVTDPEQYNLYGSAQWEFSKVK